MPAKNPESTTVYWGLGVTPSWVNSQIQNFWIMEINCHFFVKIPSNHVCCFQSASGWVYGGSAWGTVLGKLEPQGTPGSPWLSSPSWDKGADCDAQGLLSSCCQFEPAAPTPQLSTQLPSFFLHISVSSEHNSLHLRLVVRVSPWMSVAWSKRERAWTQLQV